MALDWVRRNRNADGLNIRVLNLSLGVDAQRSYVAEPLAYAAEPLWHRGVAVVAAAGNQADGTGRLDLPGRRPVPDRRRRDRAYTADRRRTWPTSPRATRVRPPDVVAPGTSVDLAARPRLDARRGVPDRAHRRRASSAAAAPRRRPRSSPGSPRGCSRRAPSSRRPGQGAAAGRRGRPARRRLRRRRRPRGPRALARAARRRAPRPPRSRSQPRGARPAHPLERPDLGVAGRGRARRAGRERLDGPPLVRAPLVAAAAGRAGAGRGRLGSDDGTP